MSETPKVLELLASAYGLIDFKEFSVCKPVALFTRYLCNVKIVSILFAAYLLCLAVYPCNDRDTCVDEVKAGFVLSETDNHPHSSTEQDFCSPFCICQCCSAHAQQATYFVLSLPDYSFIETISTYSSTAVQVLPHTVWQPPKLS